MVKEKKYQNNRNEKKPGAKYTISKGLARAKCVLFFRICIEYFVADLILRSRLNGSGNS